MTELLSERLRAFLAVARAGSFTGGGERLGLTQSAMSQAVAALERDLGEALFVRAGRRISLTQAGELVLQRADRAAAELTPIGAELAALRGLERGHLVVGSSDTLATYLLPPVFGAFRDAHPAIELQLVHRPSPELAARVAAREADLAVVSLPLPPRAPGGGREPGDAAVRVEPICELEDWVICPPGHALAACASVDLETLAEHPLLLLDRSTGARTLLEQRFGARGLAPRVAMEMNSVEVLKRLVELGFGAAVVPALAARAEVRRGVLAGIALRGLGEPRRVGLLTPTSGPLGPAARAFIELVRRSLAATAGEASSR